MLQRLRWAAVIVPGLSLISMGALAAPYKARCNGVEIPAATITSVLGEPRPLSNPMVRFHGGVDISNCQPTNSVQSIRAGTAQESTACIGGATCIRVLEADGHAFDYEHIGNITVSSGDPVAVGDTLGVVVTSQVLHLQETILYAGERYRVNPLRYFALEFDRVNTPAYSTPNPTYTTETEVVLIPERDGADGGATTAPAFQYRNSTYFVAGNADVLISGRGGPTAAKRKGLFVVGGKTIPALAGTPELNGISFSLLEDAGTVLSDFRTIYATRNASGFTHFATNRKLNGVPGSETADGMWITCGVPNGAYLICPQIEDWPLGNWRYADCQRVVVDCAPPGMELRNMGGNYFTQATSNTSVTIEGSDTDSGIYAIGLVGVSYSSWHYVNDVATFASNTFPDSGALADGAYTAYVVDLASNVTSGGFSIDTQPPGANVTDGEGFPFAGGIIQQDKCAVFKATDSLSGICSMSLGGPPGFSAVSVSLPSPAAAVSWAAPFCQLSSGTYTLLVEDCGGNQASYDFQAATKSLAITLSASGPGGWSDSSESGVTVDQLQGTNWGFRAETQICSTELIESCKRVKTTVDGSVAECSYWENCGFLSKVMSTITFGAPWRSASFSIENSTTMGSVPAPIALRAGSASGGGATLTYSTPLAQGESLSGLISVPQTPRTVWRSTIAAEVLLLVPMANIQVASGSTPNVMAAAAQQSSKRQSSPGVYQFSSGGGTAVFGTTMTISLVYADSVETDTMTARLYRWEGSHWSSAALSGQTIAKSSSGLISVVAHSTSTSFYAVFFEGQDSSAPTTSWSIQGSSSGFAGTTFLSTYSYLVLSSTDPTVNGFASGLATTYYRVDGLPGDAFAAYSSSLSFLPGTHWVDYYAVDWAGNQEPVKRATVTVTAGSVTRLSGDLQVDGNLLVGFMGSGARAEVVARAEYDYALMVSSVDRRAMLAVDNANFVSLGTAPASGRLTVAGVPGDTALALRSGNSTASVAGAQLAFGFDGTGELRHRLYTQHGPEPYQNKAVFALWTPASGSSSTLGALPVLSLEGSTHTAAQALVHVMPAGLADKELVVSDGASMGMGSVLRGERWTPSSAALKKDVKRLGRAEEDKAWDDVAALRPVRFRRLGADAPVERGYVYEETPASIRDGPGAVSADERLVNAELALKAAMRRIEELKTRIKKLKEAGR